MVKAVFKVCSPCIYTELRLRVLLNELHPVRASWYKIGLELDIPHTELDCFEQKYSDPSDLLCEVLKYWLKTSIDPPPTWEAVVTALRSRIVNEKNVAAQLESKYCTLVQHMTDESSSPSKVEKSEGIILPLHIIILYFMSYSPSELINLVYTASLFCHWYVYEISISHESYHIASFPGHSCLQFLILLAVCKNGGRRPGRVTCMMSGRQT